MKFNKMIIATYPIISNIGYHYKYQHMIGSNPVLVV